MAAVAFDINEKVDVIERLREAILNDEKCWLRYELRANQIDDINAPMFGYHQGLVPNEFFVGATLLHLAAFCGSKKCLVQLLELGARESIIDFERKTPIDRAQSEEIRELISNFRKPEPIPQEQPPFVRRSESAAIREATMEDIMQLFADPTNYLNFPKAGSNPEGCVRKASELLGRFERDFKQRVHNMRKNSTASASVLEALRSHPTLANAFEHFLANIQVKLLDPVVHGGEDIIAERKRINKVTIPRLRKYFQTLEEQEEL